MESPAGGLFESQGGGETVTVCAGATATRVLRTPVPSPANSQTGALAGRAAAQTPLRGAANAGAATGAYGRSMASNYNHVPRPPVVAVRDGAVTVLLRRETIGDLLALDEG